MWLVITRQRRDKTGRIMEAIAAGYPGPCKVTERTPPDGQPFVVWGHRWIAEQIVPRARAAGTLFLCVDNGFLHPAKGTAIGYYSITPGGFTPRMLDRPDLRRLPVEMSPWRTGDQGRVLLAMPGSRYLGADLPDWTRTIVARIRAATGRQISVRHKDSPRPLAADLSDAYVMVTHSSKAAVDAVRAGVPVICEPTCAAAPVGSTNMADINDPPKPERAAWWASLMANQFTLAEMRAGLPWRLGVPYAMGSGSQADELVAAGAAAVFPGVPARGVSGHDALRALRHTERVSGGGSATG